MHTLSKEEPLTNFNKRTEDTRAIFREKTAMEFFIFFKMNVNLLNPNEH